MKGGKVIGIFQNLGSDFCHACESVHRHGTPCDQKRLFGQIGSLAHALKQAIAEKDKAVKWGLECVAELDDILEGTLKEFGEIGAQIRERYLERIDECQSKKSIEQDTSEAPADSSREPSTSPVMSINDSTIRPSGSDSLGAS